MYDNVYFCWFDYKNSLNRFFYLSVYIFESNDPTRPNNRGSTVPK